MSDRLVAEVLSQYVDALNDGKADTQAALGVYSGRREELLPLLTLARLIKAALRPVELPTVFREQLRRELLVATVTTPACPATSPLLSRERILVGAAALGSVAAVVLVLTRARAHTAPAAA